MLVQFRTMSNLDAVLAQLKQERDALNKAMLLLLWSIEH
jgi:hypothetical protein